MRNVNATSIPAAIISPISRLPPRIVNLLRVHRASYPAWPSLRRVGRPHSHQLESFGVLHVSLSQGLAPSPGWVFGLLRTERLRRLRFRIIGISIGIVEEAARDEIVHAGGFRVTALPVIARLYFGRRDGRLLRSVGGGVHG